MSLVIKLGTTTSRTDLSTIDSDLIEQLYPFEPELEAGSYGHWVFGEGVSDFTAENTGAVLTENNPSSQIVFNGNYLTMSVSKGNQLASDRMQSTDSDEYTLCYMFKIQTTDMAVLTGDLSSSSGVSSYIQDEAMYVFARNNGRPTETIPDFETDKWVFVSMQIKHSSLEEGFVSLSINGGEYSEKSVGLTGVDYTANALPIALGNTQYGGTTTNTADFSEFIIFDKILTDDEIAKVYARSVLRAEARGLEL